jgi:hypothetical protein
MRSRRVSSASKLPAPRDPKPVRPVLQTGQVGFGVTTTPSLRPQLCGSTELPNGFLVNHRKPRELDVASANHHSWLGSHEVPAQPWFCGSTKKLSTDFILLFLPPCGPHLTPLATGSLEPSLLVFSTLGVLTGNDLARLFFTSTNTSQATTRTCNA